MKKAIKVYMIILISILFLAGSAIAQNFVVQKVTGKVLVLKGTGEEYEQVEPGEELNGSDLLITGENSTIQLSNNSSRFILKSNSALGLNYIKEVSLHDLLLALTMEEVRSIPKNKTGSSKSTAVYGSRETGSKIPVDQENGLGIKKINGARQLAESGYKESAVIVAKETYRKYPSTRSHINDRIYFADLLKDLGLMREALDEYNNISEIDMNHKQSSVLKQRIEEVSLAIANEE